MLSRYLSIVSALCLLVMIALAMADAVGRYFFDVPIHGASEIIAHLLGYTVFCALPVITRDRAHIEVGILAPRLPGMLHAPERILTVAATSGGFMLMTWLLFEQSLRMQASGVLLGYFDIPAAPLIYPIVALSGLTSVILLVDAVWPQARVSED